MAENQNQVALATYEVAGQSVTLTADVVRSKLGRGGVLDDKDIFNFVTLCKYNNLNPFLNEAYPVKYGSEPAQMIVSKEAVMKRAEANPHYRGFRAGVIVNRGGEILETEGEFYLPTDTLLGGWAEVKRDDRDFPVMSRVCLSEYDQKRSIWNSKKATMIKKVALVHALREAFPAQIGAMYISEEMPHVQDAEYQEVGSEQHQQREEVTLEEAPMQEAQVAEEPQQQAAPEAQPAEEAAAKKAQPKQQPMF